MKYIKLSALPAADRYSPLAVELAAKHGDAHVAVVDAKDRLRQLASGSAEEAARQADRAELERAVIAGENATGSGSAHHDEWRRSVVRAEIDLTNARQIEAEIDEALYQELVANRHNAVAPAEDDLREKAETYRKAWAVVLAARGELLQAEWERNYIDGLQDAIDFLNRNIGERYGRDISRPEYVFPVKPAPRPPLRRGSTIRPSVTTAWYEALMKAGAAVNDEIEAVLARLDDEADEADDNSDEVEAQPSRDDRFNVDATRRRRQRVRSAS